MCIYNISIKCQFSKYFVEAHRIMENVPLWICMHTTIHWQIFEIYSTFWPVYFRHTHTQKLLGSNVFLVGFSSTIHGINIPFISVCLNILSSWYIFFVVNDCKMDYAHFGMRQEHKTIRGECVFINMFEYIWFK